MTARAAAAAPRLAPLLLALCAAGCTITGVLARDPDGGALDERGVPVDSAPTGADQGVALDASASDAPGGTDGGDLVEPDATTPPDGPAPAGPLTVLGEIEGDSSGSNAMGPSQFGTRFAITLARGGAPVTSATVVVTSTAGAVTLVSAGDGSYTGNQSGYYGTYTLDVTDGADRVAGARLVGPAPHTYLNPLTGQRVPAGAPMTVMWAPSGAPNATLETDRFSEIPVPDTGSFTVPGSALLGDPGRLRDDRVRVRRTTPAPVAGGTAGSTVRIQVRNEVDFVIDGT